MLTEIKKHQEKELIETRKYLLEQQHQGNYPTKFEMPLGIQFELTEKCNVKCLHCYNRSAENTTPDRMKTEDWINLSNDLVKHGGVFQTIISGGEPLLLGDDLIKIMDVLHNDNTGFVLITNGFLVDDAWVKKLSKYHFYWIQVSIDSSNEEQHDNFRQRQGSWKKAVNAAFSFANAGLPTVIASSVTPQNLDNMESMVELAYGLGATSIILGEIMLSGRASDNPHILLNDEQRKQMYRNIESLSHKYYGKIEIQLSSSEQFQLKHSSIYPNKAVIVRPNGEVRVDCNVPFVIGNVLEKPFIDIWKEKGQAAWTNPQVTEYINNFDTTDIINYVSNDIHL